MDNGENLERVVLARLLRLNATIYGSVGGLVAGSAIFVATNWLIIKGGPVGPDGYRIVGPHLWLLAQYFPGYSVTFLGSLVGFGYGFVLGFVVGFFAAKVYNWLVDLKENRSRADA